MNIKIISGNKIKTIMGIDLCGNYFYNIKKIYISNI